MSLNFLIITFAVVAALGISALLMNQKEEFPLPQGTAEEIAGPPSESAESAESPEAAVQSSPAESAAPARTSRTIRVTDGSPHSIPLEEILSGGPGKDGIPSIDNPTFISAADATFLDDADPGIGLSLAGESRFYPYRVLVWHEIVNDALGGTPVLVTYCPLCATGIVFERKVKGEAQEFGVSGMLWQSNLLMYNRADREDDESLWSQVLGEAVVGVHTGEKLRIIRSAVTRWRDWREAHPGTVVLSTDTGSLRNYGLDPYGDYYTSESVSFGASFSDTRLHPKALVHGVEIDGQFKAYTDAALEQSGEINDTFAGKRIRVVKTSAGEVRFEVDGAPIASVPGFWFSWLAVHPETGLYQ